MGAAAATPTRSKPSACAASFTRREASAGSMWDAAPMRRGMNARPPRGRQGMVARMRSPALFFLTICACGGGNLGPRVAELATENARLSREVEDLRRRLGALEQGSG